MFPITEVPKSIQKGLQAYRSLFCRSSGFEHISRYITGLIVSPNKTLQGIHDLQVWGDEKRVSSRAMHEAVFEANWQQEELMPTHRKLVSQKYHGQGKHVISLDWTLGRHEKGSHIFGVKKGYDYVQGRYGLFQTILTATVANKTRLDGIEVIVQQPEYLSKEKLYLKASSGKSYENITAARERLLELLHYKSHEKSYKKITELAVEAVRQIEEEGHFPDADYAFDNGVLNLPLCRLIEENNKHWVSELESSRLINWRGNWRRIDEVANDLKIDHPQSFRQIKYRTRQGEIKVVWGFSKTVRLKRYGKKRILIIHEAADLTDQPRFLITDATHWEGKRLLEMWVYRWPCELFHEFSKQSVGFESAQVRKEEAVKRHFYLSCVAQTLLQNVTSPCSTSEKFLFSKGKITQGQRERNIFREVLSGILAFSQQAFNNHKNQTEVLDMLMPA